MNLQRRLPVLALVLASLMIVLLGVPVPGIAQEAADQAASAEPHPHDLVDQNATADTTAATHPHETATAGETQPVEADPEPAAPPTTLDVILQGKYLTILGLMLLGLVLLLIRKVNLWVRIGALVLAFVLFGLDWVYPLHPSPMCATTKLFMFKFTQGQFFAAFLAFFLVIFVPSLLGRKLFCGWVCPLGAMQDLVNKIPFKFKFKNFSFTALNAVRFALLALFFLTFFMVKDQIAMLGERTGAGGTPMWRAFSAYSVYDPINMFELLHWQIDTIFIVMMAVLLAASLLLYRPFCYTICPVGAISWLLEKISPGKIRVDRNTCNDCGVCIIKSPCPTMAPLVKGETFWTPDCTSCGECLDTCPKNSIKFSFRK